MSKVMGMDQIQIRPVGKAKFNKPDVDNLLKEILTEMFPYTKEYSFDESIQWSKEAIAAIQAKLETMEYVRYKMIVQVTVSEACNQGIRISSRCLWDTDTDNYAEYSLVTPHMYINALVFGLYWE